MATTPSISRQLLFPRQAELTEHLKGPRAGKGSSRRQQSAQVLQNGWRTETVRERFGWGKI